MHAPASDWHFLWGKTPRAIGGLLVTVLLACGSSPSAEPAARSESAAPPVSPDVAACERGELVRCMPAEMGLRQVPGGDATRVRLQKKYQAACDRAAGPDCFRAAVFSKELKAQIAGFDRGCGANVLEACFAEGSLFEQIAAANPKDPRVPEVHRRAAALFEDSCRRGFAPACDELASRRGAPSASPTPPSASGLPPPEQLRHAMTWESDEAAAFDKARRTGKGVILEIYSSKEPASDALAHALRNMDNILALGDWVAARVDVSRDDDAARAVLARLRVKKAPAVLFLTTDRNELRRVTGLRNFDELRKAAPKRPGAR